MAPSSVARALIRDVPESNVEDTQDTISSDVVLATDGDAYAGPSISLPRGKWLVIAQTTLQG